MHVIGHSLGGQAAGAVGKNIRPKIGRITGLSTKSRTVVHTDTPLKTHGVNRPHVIFDLSCHSGLDPAQPGFNMTDPDDTLGPEDAHFVGMWLMKSARFLIVALRLCQPSDQI